MIIWSLLPLGIARECATDICRTVPAYEMDAGGVTSDYCVKCRTSIERLHKLQRLGQEADNAK